jgi:hypothetical protein
MPSTCWQKLRADFPIYFLSLSFSLGLFFYLFLPPSYFLSLFSPSFLFFLSFFLPQAFLSLFLSLPLFFYIPFFSSLSLPFFLPPSVSLSLFLSFYFLTLILSYLPLVTQLRQVFKACLVPTAIAINIFP